jgi:hypothetical protein
MAQYIGEVQRTKSDNLRRLRLSGIRSDGTESPMSKISKKWQFLCDAPFKISDKCCKYLKKDPLDKMGKCAIVGTMASDSNQRLEMYYRHGCNAFNLDRPRSAPLSFWKESDIWDYLKAFQVPYSSIYDLGYERTGCIFCLFGIHLEKRNRFTLMAETHPQLYKYCMDGPLQLKKVIKYVYGIDV